MALEELRYEVKLPNENHEEINVCLDLWGSQQEPRVEIEVPAYKENGKVLQQRMYVTMNLREFDEVAAHVAKYRATLEGLKNVGA